MKWAISSESKPQIIAVNEARTFIRMMISSRWIRNWYDASHLAAWHKVVPVPRHTQKKAGGREREGNLPKALPQLHSRLMIYDLLLIIAWTTSQVVSLLLPHPTQRSFAKRILIRPIKTSNARKVWEYFVNVFLNMWFSSCRRSAYHFLSMKHLAVENGELFLWQLLVICRPCT